MRIQPSRTWLVAAVAVAGLSVSACATEAYVDEHVGVVNTKVDELATKVDGINTQVAALNGRIDGAGRSAQSAQARADAAYTLAEGKFVMSEVARTQVNFDTGKSALSDEARTTLTELAQRLKTENKAVFLEIRGHADVRGGSQSNRQLGRERAGAVGRFLSSQGVPGNRMQLGSWGEDDPKSDDTHAENRRVDIVILG